MVGEINENSLDYLHSHNWHCTIAAFINTTCKKASLHLNFSLKMCHLKIWNIKNM